MISFHYENWFSYLSEGQQSLVKVAERLLEQYSQDCHSLEDYSFIIFPMAKVYEGFLKQLLFDFKLIDKKTYEGRKFRIGRALNPDVSLYQRDEYWLFDNLASTCSTKVAQQLWDTWLHCRNRVFHYFPKYDELLTFPQAQKKVDKINRAMRVAISCYNGQF